MRSGLFVLISALAIGCGGGSGAKTGAKPRAPAAAAPGTAPEAAEEPVSETGVQVELPSGSSEPVPTGSLVISIGFDGALYVSGEVTDREGLELAMAAAAEADPETKVIVEADPQVEHGRVVEVMDLGKAAGLRSFAFVIPERGGQEGEEREE